MKRTDRHFYFRKVRYKNILFFVVGTFTLCVILLDGDLSVSNYRNFLVYEMTRMTTFIKAKLEQSDDQTNIVKYRAAANITENHI